MRFPPVLRYYKISIHAPPRGATLDHCADVIVLLISIHAPPRGATATLEAVGIPVTFQFTPLREGRHACRAAERAACTFQFTPLREGRRRLARQRGQALHISIHAPPRGATRSHHVQRVYRANFNSRPSARGDRRAAGSREAHCISIHAPPRILISIHAPPRGATEKRAYKRTYARISIHAPPRGATKRAEATCRRPYISIHAPPRGATLFICQMICGDLFQFTPLREGRPGKNRRKHPSSKFQFTPLREGRQEEHDAFTAFLKAFQFTPLREGRPQKSIISG